VVLGSVEGEHSGLASGVNNGVARVAGLLEVAVLSVVIYGTFSANLDARLEEMNLPKEVSSELEATKDNLGAAEAPEGVDAETVAHIESAIDESFVAGFRAVMLISSGLAVASALAAALLIGDRRVCSAVTGGNEPRRAAIQTREKQFEEMRLENKVVLSVVAWIIVHHLWELLEDREEQAWATLYNGVSVLTISAAVLSAYAILFALIFLSAWVFVPGAYFQSTLKHPVGLGEYL
jgi:hypothetical protein